ncbi:hypothetical protein [Wolbachia endosymbiont of Folsomia candida]|uniref:hypothetical protein n=1 Tax=Wolbachia endosymbiont of Folsomia candida TaxID=169402 RepID=UPI000A3FD44C|nr:hypothetical protein [Wolbachia endosymbiont of Folsomia candida]APR98795.1 hypothetical protein ASM33_06225 [Wolbachia endosymbiont of Folsomia candida]
MDLKNLQKIKAKTINGEGDFKLKTILMKIFKTLSRLFDGRQDVSEKEIVNRAEAESRRLGLEYDWSKVFGNQVVTTLNTVGDGNCLLHSVFGNNGSGAYKTDKAQEMRQEWCEFLGQFKSLNDSEMPKALKERLSLIFYDAFPGAEWLCCIAHYTVGKLQKFMQPFQM